MLVIMQRLCSIILYICSVYGFYQIIMGLHLFGKIPALDIQASRVTRFAVVICAKNEKKVICQLLDSLLKQDYPTNAFDVFVVADNCSDQTASAAASCGAKVFERFDPAHTGKGYALNWFFDRFLLEHAQDYDACIVFDADNLADPGFLAAMNRQVNAGHPIAVGYRLGKNPSSSWVAGCSSLFWLIQTRAFLDGNHRPKSRGQEPEPTGHDRWSLANNERLREMMCMALKFGIPTSAGRSD